MGLRDTSNSTPPPPETWKPTGEGRGGPYKWLASKVKDDDTGATYWRGHDKLYDLAPFVERHSGGPQWLELTKGTDVTEAFEAYHVFDKKARMVLEKYYVKPCEQVPRKAKFTFEEDGFYKTLKRGQGYL